jgi:hypothetical protein
MVRRFYRHPHLRRNSLVAAGHPLKLNCWIALIESLSK